MNKNKITKLAKKGWKVGTVAEFLELSSEEAVYMEMKVALASRLQHLRQNRRITQEQLASLTHTSRSRISKMENNDPATSIIKPNEQLENFLIKLNTASIVTRYPDNLEKMQAAFTNDITREILQTSKEALRWINTQF